MQITLNGQPRDLPGAPTLLEVLQSLDLPNLERGVAVSVNGEVVRRAEWAATPIRPEDRLEIVQATQGG